jgi:hypothetical protein
VSLLTRFEITSKLRLISSKSLAAYRLLLFMFIKEQAMRTISVFSVSLLVLSQLPLLSLAQEASLTSPADIDLVWNVSVKKGSGQWVSYSPDDHHTLKSVSTLTDPSDVELSFVGSDLESPHWPLPPKDEKDTLKSISYNESASRMRSWNNVRVKFHDKKQAANFMGLITGSPPPQLRIVASDISLSHCIQSPSGNPDTCRANKFDNPTWQNVQIKLVGSDKWVSVDTAINKIYMQNILKINISDSPSGAI